MGVGSPGYFVGLNLREEIESARDHIENALEKSGVGKDNPPLTHAQIERLNDAYTELGKALRTMRK